MGVVQHYVKFPGFEKVPSGLSAVNEAPGSYGAIALFLVAGILETQFWTESDDKEPGNFGDPLGWSQVGGGYTDDMRNRELNNAAWPCCSHGHHCCGAPHWQGWH